MRALRAYEQSTPHFMMLKSPDTAHSDMRAPRFFFSNIAKQQTEKQAI
jgi:hypothetical protein